MQAQKETVTPKGPQIWYGYPRQGIQSPWIGLHAKNTPLKSTAALGPLWLDTGQRAKARREAPACPLVLSSLLSLKEVGEGSNKVRHFKYLRYLPEPQRQRPQDSGELPVPLT